MAPSWMLQTSQLIGMALRSVSVTGLKSLPPSSISMALSRPGAAAAAAPVPALTLRKVRRLSFSMIWVPRVSEILGLDDLAAHQDGIAQGHAAGQQQQRRQRDACLLPAEGCQQQ